VSLSILRASSSTRRGLAVAGAAVALAGAGAACTPPQPGPSASAMYRLRVCESGDNYAINTGNGYYGAYQFDVTTWHGLGYSGLPSSNGPIVQDAAMVKLWQQRGWAPWPACSARLGLR